MPRRRMACLIGLTMLTAGLNACSSTPPDGTLRAFGEALARGDFGNLKVTDSAGRPVTKEMLGKIEGDLAGRKPTIKVGNPVVKGDSATATITYAWPVGTGVTWEYKSVVKARKDSDDKWQVYFDPATLHPDLTADGKIAIKHTAADRGNILDGAGAPITSRQKIITVRVQPKEVNDVDGTVRVLDAALKSIKGDIGDVDLSQLPQEIKAGGTAAIDVISLREPAYNRIRGTIHDLAGLYFGESFRTLAPTPTFAKALLGRVGDVTKEVMDSNPGKYQIGDQVGLGGLQQQYDDLLAGSPGVSVAIPGKDPSVADKVLFAADPKPGAALKTTLDPKAQNAADAALAGQPNRSAIVAVRISDGAMLAVANGPNGGDLNLALTGQVPPGSTFKTVTALGVLENGGAGVNTVVPCPKEYTAPGGAPIHNAHDFVLGDVPLHVDFAQSCNTAFAQLGAKFGADGLAAVAKTVGIGVPWDLGTPVYSGSVATGADPAEQAAAAFGQGRTQVSPAALAGAAAGIARGQWQQPKLIIDPAPKQPAQPGPQLKPDSLAGLKQMMREVVTDGTASSIKNTPGAPIYGKTGTAEYDNNDPNKTHSWFMGFRGDVAFAVFVENGGLSSDAAVPIAGRFCAALG
ncbi:penicillin-binding transpeptidase domain-containing protein [Planosporangium mesophilum]|uniref:Cell division protein FtsI n=1 Tax=Planosporangium mesophilum TaxID=689768 RepID=A0A8J3T6H4_9ACTN|nr:penicillin-binding transpeptidase domain-containing protein [Planosporangium mesophilum]NJC81572.1 penicillin-binding protein [Planosporangium mesophilum]GII20769.1 cell division protein FtsI [Planosporangium mesophilum]